MRSRLREEFVHAEKWIEALVRCSQERHAVELTRAFAMLLRWEGDRRRAIRLLEDLSGRVRSVTCMAALIGFAVELAAEIRDWEKADVLLAKHEELCAGTAQLEMELFSVRAVVFTHKGKPTEACLLYTSPSPRDATLSRMPSSA